MRMGFVWASELCDFISWYRLHELVWFLCPNVEHEQGFDSSICLWIVDFCGGIGWGSKFRWFVLVIVFIFQKSPRTVHRSISVFRFAVRFRPEPKNDQPVDLDLPNQGFSVDRWNFSLPISGPNRSIGYFWFSESGIFGRLIDIGLPILVWVAFPGLFSDDVFIIGFGAYYALAHDFN